MVHNRMPRPALVGLLAVAVSGLATSTASARQDPGEPASSSYHSNELRNPVSRVGTQIVHGDNYAGNDVRAPLHLPEP